MESNTLCRLAGREIHGFCTMEDLDIEKIRKEAADRWLRPNEIYAILCNYNYFTINAKPIYMPKGGTLAMFDRKVLRNFRKDGHNWKKKKDGKTIKEAHEHLKVGDQDRIHVYYAHGQDGSNIVRRTYWLLDKKHEHIVLVHYREALEGNAVQSPATSKDMKSTLPFSYQQASPFVPMLSSTPSASKVLSEEADSGVDCAFYDGSGSVGFMESVEMGNQQEENSIVKNNELRLHDINTLDWADLVDVCDSTVSSKSRSEDVVLGFSSAFKEKEGYIWMEKFGALSQSLLQRNVNAGNGTDDLAGSGVIDGTFHGPNTCTDKGGVIIDKFHGTTYENEITSSRCSDFGITGALLSMDSSHPDLPFTISDRQWLHLPEQLFNIVDVSPTWAPSAEETKVMLVGHFHEAYTHLANCKLYGVFGNNRVLMKMVQQGVFRCMTLPSPPGAVKFYLSVDGETPISQVLKFEFRSILSNRADDVLSVEGNRPTWEEFHLQTRLAHLLFCTSRSTNLLSENILQSTLQEAKRFTCFIPSYEKEWMEFVKAVGNREIPIFEASRKLFELSLKSRIRESLLEKVLEGCRTTTYDHLGQGVIHLCAILGYEWAVFPFSCSGISLDIRDAFGWTALHWASFCGRETMVAFLLSAGANPSLVTDPTSMCPGGYTAADLACISGYRGLAAYLAEKSLTAHFTAMSISGNVSGSPLVHDPVLVKAENVNDRELCLKDSLAAICRAADAAARIQEAFREQIMKLRTKAAQLGRTESEASHLIAALKIQNAFRSYHERKRLMAAAQIQYRFRAWRLRREFLKLRKHAIKIQAAYRGHLVRKQYQRILWSVSILEKAILRWRMKKKGLRGFQVDAIMTKSLTHVEVSGVEDFYEISQKQAEERVERSVIRVQAMFRSYQAQKEYRRMKLAFHEAESKLVGLLNPGCLS